jgi:hypothetical protein
MVLGRCRLHSCEAEARRFFGELLGLIEIQKPEPLRERGGCWFKVGSRQLHIGVEDPFQSAAKAHPAFAIRDVEKVFALLEAAAVGASRHHWRIAREMDKADLLDSDLGIFIRDV